MRRALLATFAALLLGVPAAAQAPVAAAMPEWLAGTWMAEDGTDWADAVWTDPRGETMLGLARSGFGRQLRGWQVLRIERGNDGAMALVVAPQGEGPRRYPLVLASAEAVEFANPAMPWPQSIRYARQGRLLTVEMSRLDGTDLQRTGYRAVIPPPDE